MPAKPFDLDTAAEMHREEHTLTEIANVCDVAPATVRRKLKEAGLYMGAANPPGQAFDLNRGRAVIAMRDQMEMTFADIGAALGITRQAAWEYDKKARILLADELATGDGDDRERDIALARTEIARANKDMAKPIRAEKRLAKVRKNRRR